MAEIVLHIGVGKTGSSSVQHHLTMHGSDRILGTDFVYCGFDRTGQVISGKVLRERAEKTGVHYFSSYGPAPQEDDVVNHLKSGIKEIHSRGLIPVFSQEDWYKRGNEFASVINRLGMKVHVVVYVRSQVEFFNAGWWQWWAHVPQFKRPEDVIATWSFGIFHWFALIDAWASIPLVESVDVRLHGRDTVNDFLSLLGSPLATSSWKNASLGLLTLKLYKAFPGLRGVYDGHIDARLAPLLDDGRKAPWVVSPVLCADIIEATRKGNLRLLELLSDGQKEEMKSDQRWWNAEAFSDKHLMNAKDLRLTGKDALEIIRRLAPILRGS